MSERGHKAHGYVLNPTWFHLSNGPHARGRLAMAAPSGTEKTKRSEQYTQKTEQQCEPIVRSTSINLRFSGILAIVENAHLLTSVIRRWVGAERESAVLNTAFSGCVGLTRTVTESPTAWSGVDEPTAPSM